MIKHTETYDYRGCKIKLNGSFKTGEFVAVATVRGVVVTGRDMVAAVAVDKVKRKIDEVGK
jgi:hypothetical protein